MRAELRKGILQGLKPKSLLAFALGLKPQPPKEKA
jgi:hypothetical protein